MTKKVRVIIVAIVAALTLGALVVPTIAQKPADRPPPHAGETGPPPHAKEKGPPDHARAKYPPDPPAKKGHAKK
jgi:hypothetical protein